VSSGVLIQADNCLGVQEKIKSDDGVQQCFALQKRYLSDCADTHGEPLGLFKFSQLECQVKALRMFTRDVIIGECIEVKGMSSLEDRKCAEVKDISFPTASALEYVMPSRSYWVA
jgi:hypothetical protein